MKPYRLTGVKKETRASDMRPVTISPAGSEAVNTKTNNFSGFRRITQNVKITFVESIQSVWSQKGNFRFGRFSDCEQMYHIGHEDID